MSAYPLMLVQNTQLECHAIAPLPRQPRFSPAMGDGRLCAMIQLALRGVAGFLPPLAASGYDVWMIKAAQKRLAGDDIHKSDGLMKGYQPYLNARMALLDELRNFARKEFQ
jgi:hypothetical protein